MYFSFFQINTALEFLQVTVEDELEDDEAPRMSRDDEHEEDDPRKPKKKAGLSHQEYRGVTRMIEVFAGHTRHCGDP